MIKTRLNCFEFSKRLISTTKLNWWEASPEVALDSQAKHITGNIEAKPANWDQALPFNQVPGPKPLPILGNNWRFLPGIGEYYGQDPSAIHDSWRQKYGDIYYIKGIFGIVPTLYCFNVDDVQQVYRNDDATARVLTPSGSYYHNVLRKGRTIISTAVLIGEKWAKQRSIINKYLMQPRVIEKCVPQIDEIASDFVEIIKQLSKKNPRNEMPDDFQLELFKWTMESATALAYNKRIGILSLNPNVEALPFMHKLEELFQLVYKLEVLPSLWKYISTKNWRRFVKLLDDLLELNKKHFSESVLTFDSDPTIPENERNIVERLYKENPKVAAAMATDVFMAGVDTTGTTMATLLYHLAKNPKKQEILRNELREHLPDKSNPVTNEILHRTSYLKAVIKESMRLAPIAVINRRVTSRDLVLSGYQIPKGTVVHIANFLMSIEEKHFFKPEEFIPERWMRTTTDEFSAKNVNHFIVKPFGYGPRSCMGQRFANLALQIATAKIIRNFNLSWNYPDATFSGTKSLFREIIDPLNIKIQEIKD